MKIITTVAFAALLFAACNSAKKSATPETAAVVAAEKSTGLTGTYWKLIELMGQPVKKEDVTQEAFIKLTENGGTVTGNGGCNIFNGTFKQESGFSISFSPMATTMMACDKMQIEQGFMEVLTKADNFTISGKNLSLNKARMAPLARFEAVAGK